MRLVLALPMPVFCCGFCFCAHAASSGQTRAARAAGRKSRRNRHLYHAVWLHCVGLAQEHPASVFSGGPPDIIGVYTTEPTFVIDIGLILPTCVLGGVLLLKNRPMGYILLPVMLCLLVVVAAVVVGQTALQLRYGVVISLREVIGYVVTFVVFGLAAAVVNMRFLLKWWPNAKRARE